MHFFMTFLVQSVHIKKQRPPMSNSNFTDAEIVSVAKERGFVILVQRYATKDMKWCMLEQVMHTVIVACKCVESLVKLAQSVLSTVLVQKARVKDGTSFKMFNSYRQRKHFHSK